MHSRGSRHNYSLPHFCPRPQGPPLRAFDFFSSYRLGCCSPIVSDLQKILSSIFSRNSSIYPGKRLAAAISWRVVLERWGALLAPTQSVQITRSPPKLPKERSPAQCMQSTVRRLEAIQKVGRLRPTAKTVQARELRFRMDHL